MTERNPRLTEAQVAKLREELEAALARLERSLDIGEAASRPVQLDQTAVGRLSRIDSLQNQMMSQGLREREQARLSAILAALRRIEEETYGDCADCGRAIAYERLVVFPETTTCVACGPG
ncbi:MAG: TraR/DksA family transcriptional regulator [Gemmatimonadota bacterium]